jgi:hypothetical protein
MKEKSLLPLPYSVLDASGLSIFVYAPEKSHGSVEIVVFKLLMFESDAMDPTHSVAGKLRKLMHNGCCRDGAPGGLEEVVSK